jgi:hypothetical protein
MYEPASHGVCVAVLLPVEQWWPGAYKPGTTDNARALDRVDCARVLLV